MVLEIPPAGDGSITGSIDDGWQTALEDVGPAGVDKGKGGKYLILPPGYKDKVPDGYIALPSPTYRGYALLRSNLEERQRGRRRQGGRVRQARQDLSALAGGQSAGDDIRRRDRRRLRQHHSLRHALLPGARPLRAARAVADARQGDDRHAEVDRHREGQAVQSGCRRRKAILDEAAREAHAWLDMQYEDVFVPPFNEGTHWALPASPEVAEGMQTNFANPNAYPVDGRGVAYSMAFFSAKHLGAGQFYLMTIVDKDGKPFDGGGTYRLTVPANAPVEALLVGDGLRPRDARADPRPAVVQPLVEHPGPAEERRRIGGRLLRPEGAGGQGVELGADDPERRFEVLFRLYGPEKPFFDKKWVLPDIEKVQLEETIRENHTSRLCGRLRCRDRRPRRWRSNAATDAVPVTVDNFIRAETDLYLSAVALKEDGFGKFEHHRELSPIDARPSSGMNRDTLYSAAVFDLDAGPVTITLPDAGKRFMSLQVINRGRVLAAGGLRRRASTPSPGRRSARATCSSACARWSIPTIRQDLEEVHALQDAIKVEQTSAGQASRSPNWDPVSQKKVRDALIVLGTTLTDTSRAFGTQGRGRSGPAPDLGRDDLGRQSATRTPSISTSRRRRTTARPSTSSTSRTCRSTASGPISVYNAEGYFQKNDLDAYSLNNITAKKNADGSVTIQFGGCDGKVPNCLPIMPGWNYTVRLYRPRPKSSTARGSSPRHSQQIDIVAEQAEVRS